jgi:hypothetical protein
VGNALELTRHQAEKRVIDITDDRANNTCSLGAQRGCKRVCLIAQPPGSIHHFLGRYLADFGNRVLAGI